MLNEIYDLFIDLDATEEQLDFPVIYTNARAGTATTGPRTAPGDDLRPLFDAIVEHMPPPRGDPRAPLQILVANLDSSDYLGRLAIGRIFNGRVQAGRRRRRASSSTAAVQQTKVTKLFAFDGLKRVDIQRGRGRRHRLPGRHRGHHDRRDRSPTSENPMRAPADRDRRADDVDDLRRQHLAVRRPRRQVRHLAPTAERLDKELLGNVSMRVEPTDTPEPFKVIGRGELQLAILIEMMRREGFELQVVAPGDRHQGRDGRRIEPIEDLVIDVPEDFLGVVIAQLGERKGMMTKMVNHGSGRVRLEFRIPARGLIGFRSQFLTDTRGTGIMNHLFDGWEPWHGRHRRARRTARWWPTAPASPRRTRSATCRSAARSSSSPATAVYEGMIVGENSRHERPGRQHHQGEEADQHARVDADEAIRLIPPRKLKLEQAIEFINDDELVEVTPKSIRLRKKILAGNMRPKKSND